MAMQKRDNAPSASQSPQEIEKARTHAKPIIDDGRNESIRGCCDVHIEQKCCDCDHPKEYCCCKKEPETCTFEIYMSRCKVSENKEPGKAELMLVGYADGRSGVFPGNGTWIQLHPKWGWRTINKLITQVTIEKGTTRKVTLMADAIEADVLGAGSWEMGSFDESALKYLTLQCGAQNGPEILEVKCHKVKDINAGTTGAIVQIEFLAVQVTP